MDSRRIRVGCSQPGQPRPFLAFSLIDLEPRAGARAPASPGCEEERDTGKERCSPESPGALLSGSFQSLFLASRHNLPRRKKVAQGQRRGRAAHRSLRSSFSLRIFPGPISGSAAGEGTRRLEGADRPRLLPQRWPGHFQVATCSARRAPVTARAAQPALARPPGPLVGCAGRPGGPRAPPRPAPFSERSARRL